MVHKVRFKANTATKAKKGIDVYTLSLPTIVATTDIPAIAAMRKMANWIDERNFNMLFSFFMVFVKKST